MKRGNKTPKSKSVKTQINEEGEANKKRRRDTKML